MQEKKIKNIAIKLLEALAYLERNKVIHGDIHCGNILLGSKQEDVKLCDFGTAARLMLHHSSIEVPHLELSGTLGFASPEVNQFHLLQHNLGNRHHQIYHRFLLVLS